jgi:DNA-binding NtrC family response regulator
MKTLLIVDDEKHCLSLYEREFAGEGYRVVTAANGTSAIALAQQQKPDCAIVDIRMPDMDGLALIQKLMACYPGLPVVINSAYHDAKDDFSSWCARAYVVKSSDLSMLKNAVAKAMREC